MPDVFSHAHALAFLHPSTPHFIRLFASHLLALTSPLQLRNTALKQHTKSTRKSAARCETHSSCHGGGSAVQSNCDASCGTPDRCSYACLASAGVPNKAVAGKPPNVCISCSGTRANGAGATHRNCSCCATQTSHERPSVPPLKLQSSKSCVIAWLRTRALSRVTCLPCLIQGSQAGCRAAPA